MDDLEYHRRLADTWLTSEEVDGTGHDRRTDDSDKLGEREWESFLLLLAILALGGEDASYFLSSYFDAGSVLDLFDERCECSAGGTFTEFHR